MPDATSAQPTSETLRIVELQRQANALRQAFIQARSLNPEDRAKLRAELDRVEQELARRTAARAEARKQDAETETNGHAAAGEATDEPKTPVMRGGASRGGTSSGTTRTRTTRGTTLGIDTTGLDPQVEVRMKTLPTGMYHLFDPATNPLAVVEVGVTRQYQTVNRNRNFARLLVRAWLEGLSTEHVEYREAKAGGSTGPLNLLPTLLPDKVRHITEVQRATLHIQIDDMDGKTEYHQTHTIVMLSRNSGLNCLWDVKNDKLIEDLTPYYGAWVTPNAEPIQRLLRKVVDKTAGKSLMGYLAGPARVVTDEVRAIFDVLKEEKLVYVNSTIDFGRTQSQNGQRVRLPRESLRHRTANCLDGALLFASLLEANSLSPGLVFVPEHALVAWQKRPLDSEEDKDADLLEHWDFLETTMISTHSFEDALASGRETAERYHARADGKQDFENFRLQRLPWLRAKGVYPME